MTVHSAFFVDRAPTSLGKLERTPQGGYRAPAVLASVGVMLYSADALRKQGVELSPVQFPRGSMVRVYTPPEVIQAAMDSLRIAPAPVTNNHPAEMVNTQNYKSVSCGSTIDSTLEFDGGNLKCHLALQDAGLLADVDRGKREVSMGYWADTLFQPGVTPAGEAYDAVRARIVYNHVAIVDVGRAGPQACLALDSAEIPSTQEENPVKLKIKGVEVDATAAQAAIDALEGQLTAVTAERDTARGELATTKTALDTATSDSALDARVAEKEAKAKLEKEKADRLKVVQDAYPDVDLTGKPDAFIDGMFATATSAAAKDPDGRKRLKGEIKDEKPFVTPVADEAPMTSGRALMIKRNRGEKV